MRGFLIVLALVAMVGGGGYVFREYAPQYLPDQLTTDAVLVDRLRQRIMEEDEAGAAFVTKFEALFPADYNELMTRLVTLYRRGGTQDEAFRLGESYMRSFIEDNKASVSAAEPTVLVALGGAIAQGTRRLRQENTALCVQYLRSGTASSAETMALSEETRTAFVNITNAMLESIASGQRTQTQYAEPTQAQWLAWLERFAALGGDRAVLEALNDDAQASALPPDSVCAAAVTMWDAALQSDDDFAPRFISYSMRQ